jgi:transposase
MGVAKCARSPCDKLGLRRFSCLYQVAPLPIAPKAFPICPARAIKYPLDKHLYALRQLVECCFSKLKQFRRVATRFEKTAQNYWAVVTIAVIVPSMR